MRREIALARESLLPLVAADPNTPSTHFLHLAFFLLIFNLRLCLHIFPSRVAIDRLIAPNPFSSSSLLLRGRVFSTNVVNVNVCGCVAFSLGLLPLDVVLVKSYTALPPKGEFTTHRHRSAVKSYCFSRASSLQAFKMWHNALSQ